MRIVTRKEWSARPAAGRPIKVSISARTALCVHHDGAVPIVVKTFEDACALMRKDQAYHQDHNGWDDIGYNFLVASAPGTSIDGLIFAGRGRDVVGAHCKDKNTPWIGVQVAIGGSQKPSPAALASVSWLHNDAQAAAGHTLAMVGHRDGFPTECPGVALYAWVKAGMPVPVTVPVTTPQAPVKLAPQEDTVKPWFFRAKTGAIVIVTPTGVRPVNPATWKVWTNLGFKVEPNMQALDPGPFAAILASLGGLVK